MRVLLSCCFSFFLIAAVTTKGHAQAGKVSAGLVLSPGIGFPTQFLDNEQVDSLDPSGRFNFDTGLNLTYGFSDNISFITGLLISFRGLNDFVTPDPDEDELRATYLVLPAGLQLTSYDLGGGWYLKGKLGVQGEVNIGARVGDTRANDQLSTLAAGAFGGVGAEWDLFGAGYLDLGITYHHGFTNLLNTDYETDVTLAGQTQSVKPYTDRFLRLSYLTFDVGFIFK